MIYSILKPGDEPIVVWIIEAMSHSEYGQRFGYG